MGRGRENRRIPVEIIQQKNEGTVFRPAGKLKVDAAFGQSLSFSGKFHPMRPITFCFLLLASFSSVWSQTSGKSFTHGEHSSGYYSTLTVGLLTTGNPVWSAWGNTQVIPFQVKLQSSHGIRLNQRISAGVGTGLVLMEQGWIMPLVAEVRGDLLKGEITPTFYAQAGGGVPLFMGRAIEDEWGTVQEEYKAKGGLLIDMGLGIKVRGAGRSSTLLTIGYHGLGFEEDYTLWGTRFQTSYFFQRLQLQAGWMF